MAQAANNRKPSSRQLRYLRVLACQRGETFTSPQTMAEASAEIERLRSRRPSSRVEVRIDRQAVDEALGQRGGGARVGDDEVTGYGSTAAWSKRS